ncbi:MAG: hypothetical protein FWE54_01725 [Methanimicrococcus sp.]|nr:hypothetical protein [Methanimicrococcus sp.]
MINYFNDWYEFHILFGFSIQEVLLILFLTSAVIFSVSFMLIERKYKSKIDSSEKTKTARIKTLFLLYAALFVFIVWFFWPSIKILLSGEYLMLYQGLTAHIIVVGLFAAILPYFIFHLIYLPYYKKQLNRKTKKLQQENIEE